MRSDDSRGYVALAIAGFCLFFGLAANAGKPAKPAKPAKPSAAIHGVGFLCTDNVDCQVSAIRSAVEVKTSKKGSVILGVGASITPSLTDTFPISPILYSSAPPGQLFALPRIGTEPNRTFLTASLITPDGLHIASRASYDTGTGFGRTAVIVDVLPGKPAFAHPTFTNTLLDPSLNIFRSAAANISDDGTIAYGFGSLGNFLWTEQSGLSLLDLPEGDLVSGATIGGSNDSDGSKVYFQLRL